MLNVNINAEMSMGHWAEQKRESEVLCVVGRRVLL